MSEIINITYDEKKYSIEITRNCREKLSNIFSFYHDKFPSEITEDNKMTVRAVISKGYFGNKKYLAGIKNGIKDLYQLPGGKVEKFNKESIETFTQTLIEGLLREVIQETGYIISKISDVTLLPDYNHKNSIYGVLAFKATIHEKQRTGNTDGELTCVDRYDRDNNFEHSSRQSLKRWQRL